MSTKPVFVATHPRACSTAFERVFMTRRDSLQTVHEPFGDAFYYGPERMGERFAADEQARVESGFADSTYKTVVDRLDREAAEGKRVFIKDICYYLVPWGNQPPQLAPSLRHLKRGVGTDDPASPFSGGASTTATPRDSGILISGLDGGPKRQHFPYEIAAEPGNPTVVPREILERFHFTFLIRHPKFAIPSFYRCCVPPLIERTGFNPFLPSEAGYDQLRALFDYCKTTGMIGPEVCGQQDGDSSAAAAPLNGNVEICVIDADDLLDDPEGILKKYCKSIGLKFRPEMLQWDSEESHALARAAFEKWDGWHDDAIRSKDLKPRQHKHKPKTDEEMVASWVEKYGQEGAAMIKQTVDDNVATYMYLKQYAIKV